MNTYVCTCMCKQGEEGRNDVKGHECYSKWETVTALPQKYDITRGNHCGIIPTSVKMQHMV